MGEAAAVHERNLPSQVRAEKLNAKIDGLPSGTTAWVVWSVAVAFVIYYFAILTGYSIINPGLQRDTGITTTQVGIVAAAYTWVYAFGQLFSGALLDRLGARKVLLPAIALVTSGAFIFAQSGGFSGLVLSQMVLALGACAGFVGAGYVGGQWFGGAKFSFMFGLVQFAASFTSAFSQNIIARSLDHVSWQTLFTYSGVFGIVLFGVALLFLKDPKPMPLTRGAGPLVFLKDIIGGILRVARIGQIWMVGVIGSLVFGSMLSMGVVWAPKLLAGRGMDPSLTTMAASLIWLGVATGCLIVPRWSDTLRRRKLPMLTGIALQLSALLGLIYLASPSTPLMMVLCFCFGLGAAVHMLSFSSAADVVEPARIGTASALVNGLMFLMGGILISRPGVRIDQALNLGMTPGLEFAQYTAWPLVAGLGLALVLALVMKESYPR
jgi:MFS family permease